MTRLFSVFFFLLVAGLSFGQQEFTLEQAVQYALQSNVEMKRAQLDIVDAKSQVLEYKAIGIPKINASVNYNYYPDIPTMILPDFISPAVDGKLLSYDLVDPSQVPEPSTQGFPAQFGTSNDLTAGVSLSALIFDGSFFVGLKAQELYKDLVFRQAQITERDVKLNVKKAFLAVLIAKKNLITFEENIANLEQTLGETKAIYNNGFAEKLDVDRLELSLNNLKIERDKIDRLIDLSRNLLKFQMGYPLDQDILISGSLDGLMSKADLESVLSSELDITRRPEYSTIAAGEELARVNIRRFKFGYLPNLTGFASYSKQLQRNELFNVDDNPWFTVSVVGLSLNLPIFDGLDKTAKIQRARVTLDKTILDKMNFENAVDLEVRNARTGFVNAQQSLKASTYSRDLAQEIYNTTQIKFKEGVGSSVEVAQAERELYTSQANYMNALYELLVAKTDLDKALGNF